MNAEKTAQLGQENRKVDNDLQNNNLHSKAKQYANIIMTDRYVPKLNEAHIRIDHPDKISYL